MYYVTPVFPFLYLFCKNKAFTGLLKGKWSIPATASIWPFNLVNKVLTLNGRQIKIIDRKLNSKSAWKVHRSVVLRMF